MNRIVTTAAVAMTVTVLIGSARADVVHYYLGGDMQATLPSGTYAGLANPNHGRTTVLYAHWNDVNPSSNHYHSKARYSYYGPLAAAPADQPVRPYTVNASDVPSGNTLPESGPISLTGGLLHGTIVLRTGVNPANEYDDVRFRTVDSLATAAAGSPEQIMFNSSASRWTGLQAGNTLSLKLISITDGLNVTFAGASDLSDANVLSYTDTTAGGAMGSDVLSMGTVAGDSWEFTPIFYTATNATPGNYSAKFAILNSNGGNSGEFNFDVTVAAVPEPGTVGLLAIAGLAGLRRRRYGVTR